MAHLFVFPNYSEHKIYRKLTSINSMEVYFKNNVRYNFESFDLESKNFISCGLFIKNWYKLNDNSQYYGGINLANRNIENHLSAPQRQVGYRMAGTSVSCNWDFNKPTAFEVLSFGVGIMRITNAEPSPFRICMGGDGLPLISSHSMTHTSAITQLGHLQLTNLIFADTYGELEQLRNQSSRFLLNYLREMKEVCEYCVSGNGSEYWFGRLKSCWHEHAQSGLWSEPPKDVKRLLKRVDYILKNTFIDNNPAVIHKINEYGEGLFDK